MRHTARPVNPTYYIVPMSASHTLLFRLANECVHLGKITLRLNCNCPNKWRRACARHGETTIDNCLTCADYESEPGAEVANSQPDSAG
jgi:hypothetical protein